MNHVIIVTGLPRSGTSLLMQMLSAGGVPVVADVRRAADEDNPRGYFEDERVKRLDREASWLEESHGKALKVVAPLLPHLPVNLPCDVLFVSRALDEVLRSQAAMIRRRGVPEADTAADAALREVFALSLAMARQWISRAPHARCLDVAHAEILRQPAREAGRIAAFLGQALDVAAMAGAVDLGLYRNR